MTQDDLPTGEMKYSFKLFVEAVGYRGDLIVSSASVIDLVKSLRLLERAGITQHAAPAASAVVTQPVCPVHGRPMKPSRKPGSFFCSAKVGDDYCTEKAHQ